eukprot:TRINITY_DN8977_c0_g1_i6.p1 TRINITY_DN8977_c0_g1~~TRINITY_DN8977_c0_g1_i6.p1  ORF type:complete len:100 (-),score=10.66 TRINITY_DN8977_c0_g1_i6:325-624(-)
MLLQENALHTSILMIIRVMAFYIAITNVMNIVTKNVRSVMRPVMSITRAKNEIHTRAKIKSMRMTHENTRKEIWQGQMGGRTVITDKSVYNGFLNLGRN